MRTIRLDEIKKHNTKNDFWLVANNCVYDVSSFIADHPGGSSTILNRFSIDCSMDYNLHSSAGKIIWEKYKIGKVENTVSTNCIIL